MSNKLIKSKPTPSKRLDVRDKKANAIVEVFNLFRDIGSYVLHDKHGYGKKRLNDIEGLIWSYNEKYALGELTLNELMAYCKGYLDITPSAITSRIPKKFRENIAKRHILGVYNREYLEAMRIINGGCNLYWAMIVTALHSTKKMSKPEIKRFINEFIYVTEELLDKDITGLTHEDLKMVLQEESKFSIVEVAVLKEA